MDPPDTQKLLSDLDAASKRLGDLADQNAAAESRLKQILSGTDDSASMKSEFDRYVFENELHRKQLHDVAATLTRQRQALQPILQDAQVDSLTGLLTRRGFAAEVRRSFAAVSDASPPPCLAVIDIDQFKRINDAYGHAAGDEALRHIAARLSVELGERATLGRFGGDEFVAVAERTLGDFAHTLDQIRLTVANVSLDFDGARCPVHFSAGLCAACDSEEFDTVIRRADRALYEAKRRGRNRVCVHRGDRIDEFVSSK